MAEKRTYAVRYIGEGVRNVPGIGVFQNGTIVFLPEKMVRALIREPDFSLVGWSHESSERFADEKPPPPVAEQPRPEWEQALDDSDWEELEEEESPRD